MVEPSSFLSRPTKNQSLQIGEKTQKKMRSRGLDEIAEQVQIFYKSWFVFFVFDFSSFQILSFFYLLLFFLMCSSFDIFVFSDIIIFFLFFLVLISFLNNFSFSFSFLVFWEGCWTSCAFKFFFFFISWNAHSYIIF